MQIACNTSTKNKKIGIPVLTHRDFFVYFVEVKPQ